MARPIVTALTLVLAGCALTPYQPQVPVGISIDPDFSIAEIREIQCGASRWERAIPDLRAAVSVGGTGEIRIVRSNETHVDERGRRTLGEASRRRITIYAAHVALTDYCQLVVHELGHVYGLEHAPNSVMAEIFSAGVNCITQREVDLVCDHWSFECADARAEECGD